MSTPATIRHRKYPGVLGVQFHPESPALWNPDALEPNSVIRWFQEDPQAQAFHQAFWLFITHQLQKSHAARRPNPTPPSPR